MSFQNLKKLFFGEDLKEAFGKASQFLLKFSLFIAPLAFLPFGSAVGIGKQVLVGGALLLAFVFWVAKVLFEAEFSFGQMKVFKMVVFVLLACGLNFLFAGSQYETFFGSSGNLLSTYNIIVLGVLFWLLVSADNRGKETRTIADKEKDRTAQEASGKSSQKDSAMFSDLKWFLWGGAIAIVFGILQLFGVYLLPFQFARSVAFNTVGTVNSLAILSGFLVAVSLGFIVMERQEKREEKPLQFWGLWVLLAVSMFCVLLISYIPVWYGLVVVSFIYFVQAVVFKAAESKARQRTEFEETKAVFMRDSGSRGVPALVLIPTMGVFILGIIVLSLNFVGGSNPLNLSRVFNLRGRVEVGPSQSGSFELARKVYGEGWKERLVGSGWGSYSKKWALHKNKVINRSQYWGARFQNGASGFTTMLVEGGLLVTFAFLLLFVRSFWFAVEERNAIKLCGIGFLMLLWFFYPFNFTLWAALFVMAAYSQ